MVAWRSTLKSEGEHMKTLKFKGTLDWFRDDRSITIAQLARKTAIPEATMERICLGRNSPSAAHLIAIMQALKIRPEQLNPSEFEETL